MDLLASYDSSSESEPDWTRVPLIPPLSDESKDETPSTNSTFDQRSTVSSSSASASTLAGQGFSNSSSSCTDDSQFSQPAPRFPTRLPPPQLDCATTTTTTEAAAAAENPVTMTAGSANSLGTKNSDLTPAEQRAQLLRLAMPSPRPEIPGLPEAPDGGRLVTQFLALKSSSSTPVHFNVKFAASMQLHDPGFIKRQAAFIGVGKPDDDDYVSKFVQRSDRNVAQEAVRSQRAAPRTRVEFTSATTAGP